VQSSCEFGIEPSGSIELVRNTLQRILYVRKLGFACNVGSAELRVRRMTAGKREPFISVDAEWEAAHTAGG
jgi:hypothetical protein